MNQYGYDAKYIEKVQRIYGDLNGDLHLVELDRNGASAIGLSLVGNRDTAVMSVFVAGIHPYSLAGTDGRIHVGDELLEINGCMLFGRSHLNASAIIKGIASSKLRILLLRNNEYLQRMAVDPLKQMIVDYRDSSSTLIPKKPKSVSLEEFQQQEGNGIVIEDEDDDDNDDEAFQRKTSPANSETTTLDGSSSIITCHPLPLPHPPPPLDNDDDVAVAGENENSCDTSNIGNNETATTSPLERNMPQKQAQDQTRKPKLQLKIFTEVNDLKDGVLNSSKEINEKEASPDSSQVPSSRVADVVEDPVTCSVISGKPTTICITKGKQALGVQIIGGSDTLLKSVFVFEIYNEGAAAKDGRLAVGDQILEANNEDFSTATHVQALQILRRPSPTLRMVVLREKSAFQEDELCDSVAVELTKKPGKGLGLSIVSKRNGTGILITDIIKGGAAEMDGRLLVGDEVVTVNGEDVHSATQDYAAKLLKTVTGKVSLLVKRMKIGLRPAAQLSHPYVSNCTSESILKKSESHAVDCKSAGKQVTKRRTLRYQAVTTCLKSPDD